MWPDTFVICNTLVVVSFDLPLALHGSFVRLNGHIEIQQTRREDMKNSALRSMHSDGNEITIWIISAVVLVALIVIMLDYQQVALLRQANIEDIEHPAAVRVY